MMMGSSAALATNAVLAYYQQAQEYYRQQQWSLASRSVKQFIALKPDYEKAWDLMGQIYTQQGQVEAAKQCYKKALSLDAQFESAYLHLGQQLLANAELPQAQAHFENALIYHPDITRCLGEIAESYRQYHYTELAIETYFKIISMDPNNADVLLTLGQLLIQKNDITLAEQCIEQAKQIQNRQNSTQGTNADNVLSLNAI